MAERPRERCLAQGPACLSLRELLAVLLGSGPSGVGCLGVAERILGRASGEGGAGPTGSAGTRTGGAGTRTGPDLEERALFHSLEAADGWLQAVPGLGAAGKARILAAFEIGRRYSRFREGGERDASQAQERTGDSAMDRALAAVPQEAWQEPREWLGFVPIFGVDHVGTFCVVERGVRTHVNVEPSELFARVLSLRPRAFVLFHNHPSGDLAASSEDRELTRQVREVAQRLGLRLLGHCVVGPRGARWIVV